MPTSETPLSHQLYWWIKDAQDAVHNSEYKDHIFIDQVDVYDAALASFYLKVQALARDEISEKRFRKAAIRKLDFKRRIKSIAPELFDSLKTKPRLPERSAEPDSDIWFWPEEPTHLRQMIPVIDRLRDDYGVESSIIISKPGLYSSVDPQKYKIIYPEVLWKNEIRKIENVINKEIVNIPYVADIDMLPRFPVEVNLEVLHGILYYEILQSFNICFKRIGLIKLMLKQFKPKQFIVGNDITPHGRATSLFLKNKDIHTACIMHGSISNEIFYIDHIADHFLIFGERNLEELREMGAETSNCIVCGAPHLDEKLRLDRTTHPLLRDNYGLKDNTPWVLIALSGPGHCISYDHFYSTIQVLQHMTVTFPDVTFLVKLHRKDAPENYRLPAEKEVEGSRLIVALGDDVSAPADIFHWFRSCSMIITGGSFVAYEAMVLDVPVISLDLFDDYYDMDYNRQKIVCNPQSKEELQQAIQTLLDQGPEAEELHRKQHEFCRQMFHKLDGHASKRVAGTLLELIGERPHQ